MGGIGGQTIHGIIMLLWNVVEFYDERSNITAHPAQKCARALK